MPVRVARGVLSRIKEDPGTIVILVERASDPALAAAALGRAGEEIGDLDGGWQSAYGLREGDRNNPKWVSAVTRTPVGPFMFVDGGSTPHRLLRTIPDIVARHLGDVGVTDAVIASPRGGALSGLAELPRAVILCLHSGEEIPERWLVEAAAWVAEGGEGTGRLHASMAGIEFPLMASDARGFLGECQAAGQEAKLAAGDLKTRARALSARFGTSSMVLGGGGPDATAHELLAEFDALRALARRLSGEVTQAYIEFESSFVAVAWGGFVARWRWEGGGIVRDDPRDAEHLFDAFCFQILGPGHLRRLGGPPAAATPLADGRVELALGTPGEWLGAQREKTRERLGPCLLGDDEALRLHQERFAGRAPDVAAEAPPLPRLPHPSLEETFAQSSQRRARYTAAVHAMLAERGEHLEQDALAQRLAAAGTIDFSISEHPPKIIVRQIGIAAAAQARPDPFVFSRAVTLALHLPPVRPGAVPRMPQHWFDEGCAWVRGDGDDDVRVTALVYSTVTFPLSLVDGLELMRDSAGRQIGPELWCGDWQRHARSAAVERHGTAMILRAGGSAATDDELLRAAQELTAVARRLAPDIAYAYIAVGPNGGHPPGPLLDFYGKQQAWLIDERVLGTYPYQILGPGHIDRLGGIPAGGRELAAGRVELSIGEFHEWQPRLREAGRRALAPCLALRDDN